MFSVEYDGIMYTDDLLELSTNTSVSLANDKLGIDICILTIKSSGGLYASFQDVNEVQILDSDGVLILFKRSDEKDLTQYDYGKEIKIYSDGVFFQKFFVRTVTRKTANAVEFECISAIGILDKTTHNGGIYNGMTFETAVADVIGDKVIYTIADELKNVPVFGWLPVTSRRINLHHLLFVEGAIARNNSVTGDVEIVPLSEEGIAETESSRVFTGGSVEHITPISGVSITEHSYYAFPTDEEKVLFDNTDGLGTTEEQKIIFEAPCHDLVASGITIVESGVNYAIVKGTGTLKGKAYTHILKDFDKKADNYVGEDNEKEVKDATLINRLNSELIADRILSYYSKETAIISTDIKLEDERIGDLIEFVNPFYELDIGFVSKLDMVYSSFARARLNVVSGFVPAGFGNYYNNVMLVTESSTITIPNDATRIRVVAISGGQGGRRGTNGTDGTDGEVYMSRVYNSDSNGSPGRAGQAGQGGKIIVKTLSITANQSIDAVVGLGGDSDSDGGETSILGVSSNDGTVSQIGFKEIFSGETYATAGTIGKPGGKATEHLGAGDVERYYINGYRSGEMGEGKDFLSSFMDGGYGGGAAVGANGEDGTDRYEEKAGDGGEGADAQYGGESATVPGSGGSGGHGGGAGGGGGNAGVWKEGYMVNRGHGATGGNGSSGGKGANGILIIYY